MVGWLLGRLVGRTIAVQQLLGSKSRDLDCAICQQYGREITANAFGLLERADAGAAQIDTCVLGAGEGAQEQLGAVFAVNHLGQSSDGGGATGFESREKGTLCGDTGTSVRVVQRCQSLKQVRAILATLDGKGPLPWSREHLQRVEDLGDLIQPAEAGKPRTGQQDGVQRAVAHQRDAGVDVATKVGHAQAQPQSR